MFDAMILVMAPSKGDDLNVEIKIREKKKTQHNTNNRNGNGGKVQCVLCVLFVVRARANSILLFYLASIWDDLG